jgi:ferritin-like metal-binding protein YciE
LTRKDLQENGVFCPHQRAACGFAEENALGSNPANIRVFLMSLRVAATLMLLRNSKVKAFAVWYEVLSFCGCRSLATETPSGKYRLGRIVEPRSSAYCVLQESCPQLPSSRAGAEWQLGRSAPASRLSGHPRFRGDTRENRKPLGFPRIQKRQIFSGRTFVKINSLQDLYVEELRDLYDAENQLVKALPKMAEASASDELRQGFEEHLEQTRGHAHRLEEIFERLGEKPKGKKCKGMEGVVKEGSEVLDEDMNDMNEDTKDAAIIGAAQRVEHYEIAAYGTARTHADLLGRDEDRRLLEETLEEEKETDEKLTQLAENINVQAQEGGESESTPRRTTARRKRAA